MHSLPKFLRNNLNLHLILKVMRVPYNLNQVCKFHLFPCFNPFLVSIKDDLPWIRIFQPEGVIVNVKVVVVFPWQNARENLATKTFVCCLAVVHCVLSILKSNFLLFPKVLKKHVMTLWMPFHFKLF